MRPNPALLAVWLVASLVAIAVLPLVDGYVRLIVSARRQQIVVFIPDGRGQPCVTTGDDYCLPPDWYPRLALEWYRRKLTR